MDVIFGVLGIGLGIFGCVIKFGKKIALIPAITEERIKKIKKVDVVANEFGNRLIMMALACIVTMAASIAFGKIGSIIGLVLIIITAVSWNTLSTSVDEKIKVKKY